MSCILNCHSYPEKNGITTLSDALLWPTRTLLGYRHYEWNPKSGGVKPTQSLDCKCLDVFLKFLLIPLVLVLLPITFIAVCIKACDFEDSLIRTYFDKASFDYLIIKNRMKTFMPVIETPESSDSE